MAALRNRLLRRGDDAGGTPAVVQPVPPESQIPPLFDPWYYRLQVGRPLSDDEAWQHFRAEGAAAGLLPHPLLDVHATGLAADDVVEALLDGSAKLFPARPIVDDVELVRLAPLALKHEGGPLGFFLEQARLGAPVPEVGGRSWRQFTRLRKRQAAELKVLSDSGVFDQEFYTAQTGRTFGSTTAMMWHFLEDGAAAGLSPTPLWEARWYRAQGDLDVTFMTYLHEGQLRHSAGPHFDGSTYAALVPEAIDHPGGPIGHYLEHVGDQTSTVAEQGSGVEPVAYGTLRAAMIHAARTFGEQQQLVAPASSLHARWWLKRAVPAQTESTDPVAIFSDGRDWDRWVPQQFKSLLKQKHESWVLRVAVDVSKDISLGLRDLADEDPRVVLVPTEAKSWAGRTASLLDSAVEPWIAFWDPAQTWSSHFLSGLLAEADADAGRGAHGSTIDLADAVAGAERWTGPISRGPHRRWSDARGVNGVLMSAERLRADQVLQSHRSHLEPWDIVLDHDVAGEYVPFIAARRSRQGDTAVSAGASRSHENAVRAAQLLDWEEIEARAPDRVLGRISVLITTHGEWRLTRRAVVGALAAGGGDIEIIVVDDGSDWEVSANLTALFVGDARVQVLRLPRRVHTATAANVAFARSTGATVAFVDRTVVVSPGWQQLVIDVLADPSVLGAQPVVMAHDGSVLTAGKVFAGRHLVPQDLLANHPVEDLGPEDLRLRAASGKCLVLRAEQFMQARGFDTEFVDGLEDVDLCLRLAGMHPGDFVTVRGARAVSAGLPEGAPAADESNHLRFIDRWGAAVPGPEPGPWETAGFDVASYALDRPLPVSGRRASARAVLVRPSAVVADGPARGLPRLRWAIKNSAPAGSAGDAWGDTFFADDLAAGLRHWGQEVVVDRREAHARPGVDDLDDVTIWLRGLTPAVPQPGAVNILWVISHPDAVPFDELRSGFDLVYAASVPWSELATTAAEVRVRPLLQATNPARFAPVGDTVGDHGALFVGSTRGMLRPIVRDAIAAGVDLQVYGRGWEEFLDGDHVIGHHLDNAELPAAYRGADVVLNDHWADMAKYSMFSNRLFDAVATGARVISDPVSGLDEVFGGAVQTYSSSRELADLAGPDSTRWPSPEVMIERAATIAAEHSFVARAKTMLVDVLDTRGVDHDL